LNKAVAVKLVRFMSRFSRVVFVVGTVALAIAGSRVANDVESWGDWLLTTAAVILIAGADVGRELNDHARSLAMESKMPFAQSLSDVVGTHGSRWSVAAIPTALFLIGLSVLAYPLQDDIVDEFRHTNGPADRPQWLPSNGSTPTPSKGQDS
jgi:hypothetical protein